MEILRQFSEEFAVEFDLLSDVGSVELEKLGLLNHQIAEETQAWGRDVGSRHDRLPFPGTFLLNATGTVTEKKFERSHRIRPSGTTLLADLTHQELPPAVLRTAAGTGVALSAWLDEDYYYPGQQVYLHVQLRTDEDIHVYVPPIAAGYVPLQVEVAETEGLIIAEPQIPDGAPFRVAGLDEQFHVLDGTVDLRIPFHVSDDLKADTSLTVSARYQTCTEAACFPPETLEVELPIRYEPTLRP